MSKFNTHKNEKIFIKCAQNRKCTSYNHYAKFEYKGMKTFEVADLTNLAPHMCYIWTDRQMDEQRDGVYPLLDLLSLKRRR